MKYAKVVLLLIFLKLLIFATQPSETEIKSQTKEDKMGVGFMAQVSGYNYFSIGLGLGAYYNFAGTHLYGQGLVFESRTDGNMYVRPFLSYFFLFEKSGIDGLGAELSGIAIPKYRTVDDIDVVPTIKFGYAPAIYIGKQFSLFYRYNIFYHERYNNHEFGLKALGLFY
jgi:hypothetical protein